MPLLPSPVPNHAVPPTEAMSPSKTVSNPAIPSSTTAVPPQYRFFPYLCQRLGSHLLHHGTMMPLFPSPVPSPGVPPSTAVQRRCHCFPHLRQALVPCPRSCQCEFLGRETLLNGAHCGEVGVRWGGGGGQGLNKLNDVFYEGKLFFQEVKK